MNSIEALHTDERYDPVDWSETLRSLNECGFAVLDDLLSPGECQTMVDLYPVDQHFRSHIQMKRYNFGRGEYKYFDNPLPKLITRLRTRFYAALVPLANDWNAMMGGDVRYPATHAEFLARCRAAGQIRPTPLLLKYGVGDYNCLHQDLYGENVFPLQMAIMLSEPGLDFQGGEFVLTEQRPRMQSRVEVVPLRRPGQGVIFAVHQRPVPGKRGYYRVNLRHGVSRLRGGERHTLGIIFHDAR